MSRRLLFVICLTTVSVVHAQNYSLFTPVPRDEMRPFSIDRPSVTETPVSVDAGHFQFEGDFYKWSKAFQSNAPRVINVFKGIYKMGLTNKIDMQLGIETYNVYQDSNGDKVDSGYGNTTLRLKYNLWGNDGAKKTALSATPYVNFPTSPVDNDVSFGIGFPLSFPLAGKLGGGTQFQFDFVPNGQSHDLSYLQTIVVGGPITGSVDFFLEGMVVIGTETTIFSANGGILYNISPNIKIDIATNLGLVDDAPTSLYGGLSFRL